MAAVKDSRFDGFKFAQRLQNIFTKVKENKNDLSNLSNWTTLIPFGFDSNDDNNDLESFRLRRELILERTFDQVELFNYTAAKNQESEISRNEIIAEYKSAMGIPNIKGNIKVSYVINMFG